MTLLDRLDSWARYELAPWQASGIGHNAIRSTVRDMAEAAGPIYGFDIDRGNVAIVEGRCPTHPSAIAVFGQRAELYRRHLEQSVRLHCPDLSTSIAISLQDRDFERRDVPLFVFQKQRGSAQVLLPDVDLLGADFFEAPQYADLVAFEDKRAEAVFVGVTTGGPVTTAAIADGTHPRIRAAMAFREKPGVTFELPVLADNELPQAEEAFRALRLGNRRWDWAEQYGYRYLISMDGNGATCSRVALALMSNGVLLKYNSPFLLHYFRGLEPWHHYIPAIRDADVVAVVESAERSAQRDAAIAARSRQFAHDYLSREASLFYTGQLLRRYVEAIA